MLGFIGAIGEIAFTVDCACNILGVSKNATKATMVKNKEERKECIKNVAIYTVSAILSGAAAYALSKLND